MALCEAIIARKKAMRGLKIMLQCARNYGEEFLMVSTQNREPDQALKSLTMDLINNYFEDTGAVVKQKGSDEYSITTTDGGTVSVTPKKISYTNVSSKDYATHKATALLIHETWGNAKAFGSPEFQRARVACGKAYGVKITAADADKLNAIAWLDSMLKWMDFDFGKRDRPADYGEENASFGS
jgi:hypothetical protein